MGRNKLIEQRCKENLHYSFCIFLFDSNSTVILTTLLMPDIWSFISYIKQFGNISQGNLHLVQFWHYLSRDSIRYHRFRALFHKTSLPISSLGCHLCFWTISYISKVLETPFSGLLNLFEWLTELRKTVYLLFISLL